MHESGTGGEPKYGIISQMPLVGDLDAQGINIANNQTYQVWSGNYVFLTSELSEDRENI